MGWDYTRVKTDDGCIALMSDDRLVVIDAWDTGGGGGGFAGTDLPVQEKIKFRIEYNLDGVKAFVTEDWIKIFGKVNKDLLKIIVLVGIIKKQKITEASLKGVSSTIIEGYLNISGIKAQDIEKFQDIVGIKSKEIEQFENITGITAKQIEQFENVVGKIIEEVVLTGEVKGIKDISACLKLDIAGVKKVLSEYNYLTKGKKDIKELITILMNLE